MADSSRFSVRRRDLMLSAAALGALSAAGPALARGGAPGRSILLINPNSNEGATRSMAQLAEQAVAQAIGGSGLRVIGERNAGAPSLLTTPQDMVSAATGVVRIGRQAAKDPRIGAIIVSAFSDPGLDQLRQSVSIPVFGIGEQAFREAARGGRPFAIATVTPDPGLIESFRQKAASLGYAAQYRGTLATEGDPKKLVEDPALLDAALAKVVRTVIDKDGAQAVIMGGGPLSASAVRLQPQFDVPLIVAVSAAARAAAAAIGGQ
ncbi:aspartate/glutamate racemase family protein [Castellaniella sp.]|uniref:aspartate/glutamate racemase family protein n=1 Tax=Castellaniella sp. TaxID=1955812 RepID=UPI003C76EFBC